MNETCMNIQTKTQYKYTHIARPRRGVICHIMHICIYVLHAKAFLVFD